MIKLTTTPKYYKSFKLSGILTFYFFIVSNSELLSNLDQKCPY